MRDEKLKKVLYAEIFIYACTWIYGLYHNLQIANLNGVGMGFVALLTPCIVPVLFKVLKLKPVYEIYIINVLFVYFASLVGSCYGWYGYPMFDKVLHFCSGWFMTLIGVMVFCKIKHVKKIKDPADYSVFLLFINCMNLAVAVLWEFYEFLMLVFFNNDCIHHFDTGVYDSMTDMMCAFVAGLIMTFWIVRYYKSGKKNFFIHVYESFYDKNIEKNSGAN